MERHYNTGKRDKELEMTKRRSKEKERMKEKKLDRGKNKAANVWLMGVFFSALATVKL